MYQFSVYFNCLQNPTKNIERPFTFSKKKELTNQTPFTFFTKFEDISREVILWKRWLEEYGDFHFFFFPVHYRAWTESTQHKFEDTWQEQQPLELILGKGRYMFLSRYYSLLSFGFLLSTTGKLLFFFCPPFFVILRCMYFQ